MAEPNTFAGAGLDRASVRRADPEWVAGRVEDPASRALVVASGTVLVTGPADAPRLARLPLDALPGGPGVPVLLGVEADGTALFALDGEPLRGRQPLVPGARLLGLREAGALLAQDEGGLAAYASALANWHRSHPHCARCGAVTDLADGGHVRRCPYCGAEHFPRTDPVVIMLVLDGDRVLLGRQASWPARQYSALAGFVEAGETLEEAVAREVLEETGVEVADPRYVSSQPWPFPSSLMLGFTATYAGGEPAVTDHELEDVRWFDRDELRAAVEERGDGLRLPPRLAIARRLIEGWLAGPGG